MRRSIIAIALLALMQGCGGPMDNTDGGDASPDGAADASRDGANEAAADTRADGPSEASNDSGSDSGSDSGLDTGTDASTDAAVDTGADASTDTDASTDSDANTDTDASTDTDAGNSDSGMTLDAGDRCPTWDTAPTVDSSIAIPASAGRFTVALHASAAGTQNYACVATTGSSGTTYAWTLTGPDAVLSDCTGATIGHHQASSGGASAPQWTDTDGSSVIGSRVSAFNADPTAVPWLLLHITSSAGNGVLTPVQYVQRVNTVGGKAPSTGCDATAVGATTNVDYTADYYFYAPDTNACAGWDAAPSVDPSIAIPASAGRVVVALHASAAGTQNYACVATTGSSGTTYAWTLTGPDAVLSDCTGATIGHHQASSGGASAPQWTDTDGSSVIGSRVSAFNADPTAVPWLLLHITSSAGNGVLTPVQYVQRVNTVGGKAPSTGCDATAVGATTSVNYTADYYFYAPDTTGCATWDTAPTVDPSIAVPSSAGSLRVALHTSAAGTQNYACVATTGSSGTTYAWTLTGPDAVLSDCTGATVGHHQASSGGASAPQWTDTDGSSVIGSRVSAFNADPTAVPWLLLQATSTAGAGVLTPVQYVQRVNTVGGKAPSTGCDATAVGATTSVNYTADYYFYAP